MGGDQRPRQRLGGSLVISAKTSTIAVALGGTSDSLPDGLAGMAAGSALTAAMPRGPAADRLGPGARCELRIRPLGPTCGARN